MRGGKIEPDITIPVDSPNIPTQFSIHNSRTKFVLEKPENSKINNIASEREHVQTTFSVKEVPQDYTKKPSVDEISDQEPNEERK